MIRYAAFDNFVWLWLVPAVAALGAYALWQRKRAIGQFLGHASAVRLAGELSVVRGAARVICVSLALTFIVFALARPQWGKYWTQQPAAGRDLIVAIDVSRSMLADDVVPSRLERAKADVRDLVVAVEESGGHRIGLIAFAGSASLKCPLTQITGHFKLVLDGIDTRSVARGGTMIGDCIRQAIDAFDDKTHNYRDLILISDGEDMESFPVEAAAEAAEQGITIYTIGLGDPVQGARIPISDRSGQRTFLEHEGEVVWSKLDDSTLKQVARATGGIYVPAETRAIELDQIFRDVIEPKEKRELAEMRRERYHDRFQWLLLPGVILLAIELLVRDTRRAKTQPAVTPLRPVANKSRNRQSLLPAAIALLFALTTAGHVHAADAGSLVRQGTALYQEGQYEQAAERFAEAARLAPNSPIPLFNQAAALFQAGNYEQAAKIYQQARVYAPENMRRKIDYALGNSHLQQALGGQAQPDIAMQHAKQATEFYRNAIKPASTPDDPTDPVADSSRYNMELAKRLIQKLEQQQQQQQNQQQQQQNQQQKDQQQQDQQSDSRQGDRTDQSEKKDGDGEPKSENQQELQETAKQGDGEDKKDGRPQNDREQSDSQAGEEESAEKASRSQGEGGDKLTEEEASERLRSAMARAHAARSRRLADQQKQARPKSVKDW